MQKERVGLVDPIQEFVNMPASPEMMPSGIRPVVPSGLDFDAMHLRLPEHVLGLPSNFEFLAETKEGLVAQMIASLPLFEPQNLSLETNAQLAGVVDSVYQVMTERSPRGDVGLGASITDRYIDTQPSLPENSTFIKAALRHCIIAHSGQNRKSLNRPFAVHPIMTAWIAAQWTDDPVVIAACLLHDVLEDCSGKYQDAGEAIIMSLNDDRASQVLAIVRLVTKDGSIKDKDAKNRAYLETLKRSNSPKALITAAADKTHNLYSTKRDISSSGGDWSIFSAGREGRRVWYRDVTEVIAGIVGEDSTIIAKLYDLRREVFPEDFV